MGKKLYSFDIFDTLITRTTVNPDGIFLIVENKLKNPDEFKNYPLTLKNNFSEIRKETQMFSLANKYLLEEKYDCTLDYIYENIKNNFNLSEEEKEQLKNIEIETEFENILPVQKNIEKLKDLIKMNEKIILISDMYLSSEIIRKFLMKTDEVFKDIKIFCSAEAGKSKVDGLLFKEVIKKYPDYELIHFGDNKVSDFITPKLNGIKAQRFYPEPLKKYEEIVLKENKNCYSELSVGISRYLRSLNKTSSYTLGCSFAAPILYTYVYWILEQAKRDRKEHLYFVARDGFILKIIADEIINQLNLNIKTHYFYSSRIANRIIDENNLEDNLRYFWFALKSKMNLKFLEQVLNVSELNKYFKIDKNKIFSEKEFDYILKEILSNEEIKNLIFENNKEKKEIFIKYLKQEIDLSSGNFAFVELNGTGMTQDNISDLICQNSDLKTINSFFLVSLPSMKQKENSIKRFYYYPGEIMADFLELLCRTEHGQTIGYREENGKIEPVLETETYETLTKWGFKDYIEGIKKYSEMMSEYMYKNKILSSDIKMFMVYFEYFRFNLDRETKDIIKKIPFSIFGKETKTKDSLPTFNFFCVMTNKTVFKHFLARKYYGLLKRIILLIIIIFNRFNINSKEINDLYYRFFLGKKQEK